MHGIRSRRGHAQKLAQKLEDARAFLTGQGIDVDVIAPQVDNKFMSAFVRATKPAACRRR